MSLLGTIDDGWAKRVLFVHLLGTLIIIYALPDTAGSFYIIYLDSRHDKKFPLNASDGK